MHKQIDIAPAEISRCLVLGFCIVFILHLAVLFVSHGLKFDTAMGLVPLFHFDSEANVPTIYTVALILIASAGLFAVSSLCQDRGEGHQGWRWLGYIFLFLAADEIWSLHELLDGVIRDRFETGGIFYYAWVVPYAAILLCVGIVLLPWFLRLERKLQVLFVIAGGCYVGGAMGVEMIGGAYYSTLDEARETYRTLTGDLISTLEESLEMIGLSLFIYVLSARLSRNRGCVSFTIDRRPAAS